MMPSPIRQQGRAGDRAAAGIGADLHLVKFTHLRGQLAQSLQRNKLNALKRKLHTVAIDVSDPQAVDETARWIGETQPHLDAVVNSAGGSLMGGVAEISFEAWSQCLAVDLNSIFLMSKAALPLLQANRGNIVIVNVASISGLFADHRMPAYNTAKGGIINLTRSLAVDYVPVGIHVRQ